MSVPIPLPEPARGDQSVPAGRWRAVVAPVTASLAVVAGTAVLGVAAGICWAALAPRAWLVMISPGSAGLINAETSAFIVADAAFCLASLVGGVVSGVLGYLFAVRRYGPLAMVAVFAGALAAAWIARWIGQQSGLATFQHLLATLPAGAKLRDSLTLGAGGAQPLAPGRGGGRRLPRGAYRPGKAPGRPGCARRLTGGSRCGRFPGGHGRLSRLGACFPGSISAAARPPR
jgi:hypothetical protein